MRYEAFIFDLDGTLVDLRFKFREARKAIIQEFRSLGLNTSHMHPDESTQALLEMADERATESGRQDLLLDIKRISENTLDRYEITAAGQSELKHGAVPTLEHLRENGNKLGLMTNSGERAVKLTLSKHSLQKYFESIVTRNDISKLKPHSEGLVRTMEILHVTKKRGLYVGDSVFDVRAAQEAGMDSAAVLGGAHSRELLQRESPKYLISRLDELMDLTRPELNLKKS